MKIEDNLVFTSGEAAIAQLLCRTIIMLGQVPGVHFWAHDRELVTKVQTALDKRHKYENR